MQGKEHSLCRPLPRRKYTRDSRFFPEIHDTSDFRRIGLIQSRFSRVNPTARWRNLRIRGSYLGKFICGRSFYDIVLRARNRKRSLLNTFPSSHARSRVMREIRLNVKIDSAVENAVANGDDSRLDIDIVFDIDRTTPRPRHPHSILRYVSRRFIKNWRFSLRCVFIIHRYVSVSSLGQEWCYDTSGESFHALPETR